MEELLKLIKANMREGADIAAIETLVKGLDPLAGVKTKEDAIEFITKTDVLNKGLDSAISKAVKNHDDKFSAEKLPELLKAEEKRIRAEINPTETKEQKTIREQKERIDALEANGKRSELKAELQKQAKDLGYSGNIELFLGHGEKASEFLKAEAERYKTDFDSALSDRIKEQFPNVTPQSSVVDPAKSMKRSDYEAMSPLDQSNVDFKEVTIVD